MSRLCELGAKYGTDKSPLFEGVKFCRDWMKGHSYTPFYYELFKDSRVNNLLEIGIDTGASLLMWRDFFPSAHIYGIDINLSIGFNHDRIQTFRGDATHAFFVKGVCKLAQNFEIIIDDGSHDPEQQYKSALLLLEHCLGFYIIEDCSEASRIFLAKIFGSRANFITFDPTFPTKDDCICIIEV